MGKQKKSAEQKRAIRQEGWREAKAALRAEGKEVARELKAVKPIVTEAIATGGVSVGGVAKAAKNLAASGGVDRAGHLRRQARAVKGIVKGIFNDPSWWSNDKPGAAAYPYLPVNIDRPFSPDALRGIFGNVMQGPTPMFSVVNLEMGDFLESTPFKMAMGDIFREIRNNIGKNFGYTIDQFRDFIDLSISLYIRFLIITKRLGWYNYDRDDDATMHDTVNARVRNPLDSGLLNAEALPLVRDIAEYSDAMMIYPLLREAMGKLILPASVQEFYQWLISYYYVDQSGANPQIYGFDIRKAPIYTFNAVTKRVEHLTGIDLLLYDDDLPTLINEIELFISSNAVMLADMQKYVTWPACVAPYEPLNNEVQPAVLRDDPELFNAIINGYTFDVSGDSDVVRLDFLPNVWSDDQLHVIGTLALLGVLTEDQAVASDLGTILFKVMSQTFYVSTFHDTDYPTNGIVNYSADLDGSDVDVEFNTVENSHGIRAYQFSTLVDANAKAELYIDWHDGLNMPVNGNSSRRLEGSGWTYSDLTSWAVKISPWEYYTQTITAGSDISNLQTTLEYDLAWRSNAYRMGIQANITSWSAVGVPTGVTYEFYTIVNGVKRKQSITNSDIYCNLSNVNGDNLQCTLYLINRTGDPETICTLVPTAQEDSLLYFFLHPDWFINRIVLYYDGIYSINFQTSGITEQIAAGMRAGQVAWITDNWDYHIPFVISGDTVIKLSSSSSIAIGTQTVTVKSSPVLVKQAWRPVIVNTSELAMTNYQMISALFSGWMSKNDVRRSTRPSYNSVGRGKT